MQPIHSLTALVFASGLGAFTLEKGILGFALLMVVLLLVIRAKRSHDQKRRRAASSGFYDFDVAHYGGPSGAYLAERSVSAGAASLAPSFVAPDKGGHQKAKGGPVPVKASASVADVDRSIPRPVPAFDQAAALGLRPPSDGSPVGGWGVDLTAPDLPLPSSPAIPRTPHPDAPPDTGETTEAPLPLLVQPPPPAPRSD